jgi:hypothetical protein
MPTNKKTNKAAENKAAYELTADEHKLEAALLALLAIGRADLIDTAIKAANMAATEAEHAAARPQTAEEKALAALQAIGLDMASLEPVQATAANLAVSVEGLRKAFGKYSVHIDTVDTSNGTSLVTHYTAKALLSEGHVDIGATLRDINKVYTGEKAIYKSPNHFATLRKYLRLAGFNVIITKAGFRVTA